MDKTLYAPRINESFEVLSLHIVAENLNFILIALRKCISKLKMRLKKLPNTL